MGTVFWGTVTRFCSFWKGQEFSWDCSVGDTLCRSRGFVALVVDCSKPFNSVFT